MYDVAIIGGGPGGCHAAELAGRRGLKTILFEQEELGGVCLNYGCIPIKLLLHAARLYETLQFEAPQFGIGSENFRWDFETLWKRKERTVIRLQSALQQRLQTVGVELVNAEAIVKSKSTGKFLIVAGNHRYEARQLILATGGKPHIPDIPGIHEAIAIGFAVTPKILSATFELPSSLLILGGGAAGIELATFFRIAGSEVTIIEAGNILGGKLDFRLAQFLSSMLKKRGVKIHTESTIARIGNGWVTLTNGCRLTASKLLIACGWESKIEVPFHSGVQVIGDANGRNFLAPIAEWEAKIAVDRICGIFNGSTLPPLARVIFAIPEVATAGLTLNEARKLDSGAYERKLPLTLTGRYMVEHPLENGFGIGVYSGSDELLGVHLAGSGVAELISSFKIRGQLVMPPHPSLSEFSQMLQTGES